MALDFLSDSGVGIVHVNHELRPASAGQILQSPLFVSHPNYSGIISGYFSVGPTSLMTMQGLVHTGGVKMVCSESPIASVVSVCALLSGMRRMPSSKKGFLASQDHR